MGGMLSTNIGRLLWGRVGQGMLLYNPAGSPACRMRSCPGACSRTAGPRRPQLTRCGACVCEQEIDASTGTPVLQTPTDIIVLVRACSQRVRAVVLARCRCRAALSVQRAALQVNFLLTLRSARKLPVVLSPAQERI